MHCLIQSVDNHFDDHTVVLMNVSVKSSSNGGDVRQILIFVVKFQLLLRLGSFAKLIQGRKTNQFTHK